MSRIDQFKNAEVKVAIRTGDRVSMSLVGARVVQKGNQPAMYTYKDGRTCSHSDGEFHDCAYVSARDRLIYKAEFDANAECRRRANEVPPPNFDRLFFSNMDNAWRERV